MYSIGYFQYVVFGGNSSATSFSVIHASPEGAAAAHAVRHEYIRLVYQLQMSTFCLNEMEVAFAA